MVTRIIAKLDVKPPFVVKPVHFEGLRKVGLAKDLAERYYLQGADEIFYIDIVASLYQREILFDEIESAAERLFVPMAVGGGVRSINDFSKLFHCGADKVVINTYAAQENPDILNEASEKFGRQAVVLNVEAKYCRDRHLVFTDCGRITSGRDVMEWIVEAEQRGVGEILLQSVDRDGRRSGFDLSLAKMVVDTVDVPVVVGSGAGSMNDIKELITEVNPSGIAISSVLHYGAMSIEEIRRELVSSGLMVA